MELIISRKIKVSKGRVKEDQRGKQQQKEGEGDQCEKQGLRGCTAEKSALVMDKIFPGHNQLRYVIDDEKK